ncbi:MAG: DUF1573 domain-containing protein [Thermoguttaceae bacterium]|nr:DUF1573 domain-containing protein [Thermoguttaceae bacterium]
METFLLSWMLMLGALTGAGNFPVDMFETTSHQFGTVVRGAKTEYEFVFTNKYLEDVIVESVQSSCQCTTPTLLTPGPIKTHQQGRIKIHINTQNFTGNKNATITVRFAAPQRVEMQLHSYVFIRSDVSVNPGIVYFGSVDLAKTPNPGISVNVNSINYGWKILDVQSECKFLKVELKQMQAYQGTTYNMVVRLLPNAPPGPFSQVLELVTNDDVRSQRIPVRVEGRIKQTLSASPSPLSFNMVELGKSTEKTLILQGAEPFKILDITSDDRSISASIDRTPKKVQPIKLTYTGKTAGEFNGSITILTDLEGGMNTSVHFNGKVTEPVKPVEEPELKTDEPAEENASENAGEKAPEDAAENAAGTTEEKSDEAVGDETEDQTPKVKDEKEDSPTKKETLDSDAEAEKEKASETDLDAPETAPQNEDGAEANDSEKDEESLDLLDLPEKEDHTSKKTEALPLDFGDEEEADEPAEGKTEKPSLEKADGDDEEKADGVGEEKADGADEEKADGVGEEKADGADEEKADQPAAEKGSDDEFENLLPDDVKDPSADSEKADSATTPKAKIKGRNLLKKK